MFTLIGVFAKIVAAIVVVIALMQISTMVTAEPQPHRFLNLQSEGIWPNTPFRVARKKQTYERVPAPRDPFPFKFRADREFNALNGHQFKYKGTVYTLVGAPVFARNAVCKKSDGRRYACGLNAFRALNNAMRGRFLECRISNSRTSTLSAYCVHNGRSIGDRLKTLHRSLGLDDAGSTEREQINLGRNE